MFLPIHVGWKRHLLFITELLLFVLSCMMHTDHLSQYLASDRHAWKSLSVPEHEKKTAWPQIMISSALNIVMCICSNTHIVVLQRSWRVVYWILHHESQVMHSSNTPRVTSAKHEWRVLYWIECITSDEWSNIQSPEPTLLQCHYYIMIGMNKHFSK